ncbi:MAG: NAD(P)H-hydrate dehydratase [Desulfovibrionaceae bacterium]|nr:NAD(P)H-hydrate dehydratase [Desulfovibrionaceae bacterium]
MFHSTHCFAPLPTPHEMSVWDKEAQAIGIHGLVLMENAARAAVDALLRLAPRIKTMQCAALVGSGNNGGDAVAMARILFDMGVPVTLYCLKDAPNVSAACASQLAIAEKLAIPKKTIDCVLDDAPKVLLDGLVGTGLTKDLRPDLAYRIDAINKRGIPLVVAIDIPSGLNGTSGKPQPVAIAAKLTICMEAIKLGLEQPYAKPWVGRTLAVPIGIPKAVQTVYPASAYLLKKTIANVEAHYPNNSHKKTFGSIAILGGAQHPGAAHLAARASLRMGAGLVTCVAPKAMLGAIYGNLPELMLHPVQDTDWPKNAQDALDLNAYSCLVVGPGMGMSDNALSFIESLLSADNRPPCIVDADALSLLARAPKLMAKLTDQDIITPHPGEAARLLSLSNSDVQDNRPLALRSLCALNKGVVILKGAKTLIGQGNGPMLVSPWDLPKLAIAGAGDVLSGLLAALSAQRAYLSLEDIPAPLSALLVAAVGVMRHSAAAKRLAEDFPLRGMTASMLADALPMDCAQRKKDR